MKKKFMLAVAAVLVGVFAITAGVNITKVDKVSPNDEMFMDMAVSVAKTAKKPIGAVVVLNGALRSQGTATATGTAEENAIKSSRRKSLYGGSIYTIIQPTTEAYNAICRSGADARRAERGAQRGVPVPQPRYRCRGVVRGSGLRARSELRHEGVP